jgi:hypothetical protein
MSEEIRRNVERILRELPPGVILEAAAKSRAPEEILQAIEAGVKIVGQNYVQEAEGAFSVLGHGAKWHMIGHLQRNKAKRALEVFDMIETLDSLPLAAEIERRCQGRTIPVLIEVNSGREPQKSGVLPEGLLDFAKEVARFPHLGVLGLMTMGPRFGDPEAARPYFRLTKELFGTLDALGLPQVEMRYLSMGMSNTYQVAIEEGANIVRIGSMIFGGRPEV